MDAESFLSNVYNQFLSDNNLKDFATWEEEQMLLDYPAQPEPSIPIAITTLKTQSHPSDIRIRFPESLLERERIDKIITRLFSSGSGFEKLVIEREGSSGLFAFLSNQVENRSS
jgi:hypothetical protein